MTIAKSIVFLGVIGAFACTTSPVPSATGSKPPAKCSNAADCVDTGVCMLLDSPAEGMCLPADPSPGCGADNCTNHCLKNLKKYCHGCSGSDTCYTTCPDWADPADCVTLATK